MSCAHAYEVQDGYESAFSVDFARIVVGRGVLDEVGEHARALGGKRVALFTDRVVGGLEHVARARRSLVLAGPAVHHEYDAGGLPWG